MIKTIAYFTSQCARNSTEVMNAFLDSCSRQGWKLQENSWDSDVAVIWSVLWNGRMTPNRLVYEHYKNQGRPVIVIDAGALQRGHTWKLAVDNINATGYYGHTTDLDQDRPRKLGLELAPARLGRKRVIISAQHKKSLQVATLPSLEHWVNQQISKIRECVDMPIFIRPHPRCDLDWDLLPKDVEMIRPKKLANTYDDYDQDFDCYALVNYNSGPGIQAAIHGCPVIVDPSSLAYPVSIKPEDIGNHNRDRERWFIEICHTEYTVPEIRQGLWLKRIRTALNQ